MTFLPVVTQEKFEEYSLKLFNTNFVEHREKMLKTLKDNNPWILSLLSGTIQVSDELNKSNEQLKRQMFDLITYTFTDMYYLLDEQAKENALKEKNIKPSLN